MDPQSVSFTPQSDIWRLSDTMRNFQTTQQEHSERLVRLERRQDGDAKLKSVWGATSPFPSGLSGTPQQAPQRGSNVDFDGFDDEESSNNMVRSLHLDAEEEPRRLGAASRANSVRFDESAKQGQWNHAPRSSVDVLSRVSSGLAGLGGFPMFERTSSHKSEGRQSSAGQSASGRANSLGLETSQLLGSSSTDLPSLVPGLMLLGTVPSIIRCWLNMNFKHDALLYAAVCTGSYKSTINTRLVDQLGLSGQIRHDVSGKSKLRLVVYLPEAISHPASSRPNSPAPQLPAVTVDFTVFDHHDDPIPRKDIQIFLGSDMLQQHSGDVLFSSNTVSLIDDERNRVSIPLVRPESDETFKSLYVTSSFHGISRPSSIANTPARLTQESITSLINGTDATHDNTAALASPTVPEIDKEVESRESHQAKAVDAANSVLEDISARITESQRHDRKPSLSAIVTTKTERDLVEEGLTMSSTSRTSSSPAAWGGGSWRRDGANASSSGDWASATRNTSTTYRRPSRDGGIKVLKSSTSRQPSRTSNPSTQSNPAPQSRFFDEGRRRAAPSSVLAEESPNLSESGRAVAKEGSGLSTSKTRSANPIGGASAFGWLTSGQK